MTSPLFSSMPLSRGPAMPNRMMLAPLTNLQSNEDGTLSDDEYRWLLSRAQGGFGLTMTCAASVQLAGKSYPGQLGIYHDRHLPGLSRLAQAINATGSLSSVQLHHGGPRSDTRLAGEARCAPWDDKETGSRAMSTGEVQQAIEDFILAGLRAQRAGFHGIEVHGAHSYLLCKFLDPKRNLRADQYGGDFENRIRVFLEIVSGLRARAGKDFQIGVRLSGEKHGVTIAETRVLAERLMTGGQVDYLDLSLWDVFKTPEESEYADKPLIAHFTDLQRGNARLGVAGKIMSAATAAACLEYGADFVLLGRAAILHRDFPQRVQQDPHFVSVTQPVTRAYLRDQGLGPVFIEYMKTFRGFLANDELVPD